jgi:hypothetical protein
MADFPEWRPDHVVALGGFLAPVQVDGLVVADIFPCHLRLTEPHARRVLQELKLLRETDGDGAARVRALLKLHYWPKLLEAVLVEERTLLANERKRKLQQERRDRKRAALDGPDVLPRSPPPLPPPLDDDETGLVLVGCTCCSTSSPPLAAASNMPVRSSTGASSSTETAGP